MTKEEYERLLQSDYWKGYSFSLIKERNFTCHDCGRSFPGERNKLQVHHLHYRDANPWSYDPEEVVVLCRECHQKRHGIYPPRTEEDTRTSTTEEGQYCKSYDTPKEAQTEYIRDPSYVDPLPDIMLPLELETLPDFVPPFDVEDASTSESSHNNWGRYYMLGLFALILLPIVVITIVIVAPGNRHKSNAPEIEMNYSSGHNDLPERERSSFNKKARVAPKAESYEKDVIETEQLPEPVLLDPISSKEVVKKMETGSQKNESKREKSTLELLEERNHAYVVEQARRAGVSTKGSTSDILDRLNHKSVVDQARRAGVSTEGSTSDILDRLNHKSVVDQARRAGVSTEGSTSDILDRLNHKSVVDQARRAGVSTEGSTSDILDRLNHKSVVDQAKRAGVNTEGSTSDILERLIRKQMETK